MANKYLKGGALNPAWCDEQDAAIETENIMNSINFLDIFNNIGFDLNLQLGEGVNINITKNREPKKEMCTIANTKTEYSDAEAKLNYLKYHSNTPEELELSMKLIGLK